MNQEKAGADLEALNPPYKIVNKSNDISKTEIGLEDNELIPTVKQ
jgi:hypothetical protein